MSTNLVMTPVDDNDPPRPHIQINDWIPLLDHEMPNHTNKPPLANPESVDLDGNGEKPVENGLSDDEIPEIGFRAGEDETDTLKPTTNPTPPSRTSPAPSLKPGAFSYASAYGHDLEIGTTVGDLDSIPDINVYQHKKTLAQGMMDLALFSANANQLRYVLESFNRHPYYYPSLVFISISLLFQVAIGIGLIWNATYNVKDEKEICVANKINNFTVIGIFLVTVINVFISAFGVATPAAVGGT